MDIYVMRCKCAPCVKANCMRFILKNELKFYNLIASAKFGVRITLAACGNEYTFYSFSLYGC